MVRASLTTQCNTSTPLISAITTAPFAGSPSFWLLEVGAFYWTVLAPDIVNSGREEQGLVSV